MFDKVSNTSSHSVQIRENTSQNTNTFYAVTIDNKKAIFVLNWI